MKDWFWKYRAVLGALFVLLIQTPFVYLKLETVGQGKFQALMEVIQLVLTSGLVGYLFSRTFTSLLEKRLYGGLRQNWKEVRVMYADGLGRGAGEAYPREPTLLIQPPIHGDSGPSSPIMNGPVLISFNSGYVGQPGPNEKAWDTGTWSELQSMEVGPAGFKVARVGFPAGCGSFA